MATADSIIRVQESTTGTPLVAFTKTGAVAGEKIPTNVPVTAAGAEIDFATNTSVASVVTAVNYAADKSTKAFFLNIAITPTILTAGANLFWIRNSVTTSKIKIQRVDSTCLFTGTAAASRSGYQLLKIYGVTSTTGTTTLAPTSALSGQPASIADSKVAPAGGTLAGTLVQQGVGLATISHPNQLTTVVTNTFDMPTAPLVLQASETLVLRTETAIVAGSTIILSIRWVEE